MEPIVLAGLDKISDRDASHLMYSYSVRDAGNPALYAVFDARLKKMINSLDYPSMFNTIYYMLFRDISSPDLWRSVIETTLNNDAVLPLIYYRPFKAAKVYMQQKFKDWDLTEF